MQRRFVRSDGHVFQRSISPIGHATQTPRTELGCFCVSPVIFAYVLSTEKI